MDKELKAYEKTITDLKDVSNSSLFLAKMLVYILLGMSHDIFICISISIGAFFTSIFMGLSFTVFLISHFLTFTIFRQLSIYKEMKKQRGECLAMLQAIKDIKEVRRLTKKN